MAYCITIEAFAGAQLTPEMIQAAAQLFTDNYGIWSTDYPPSWKPSLAGKRVSMSPNNLRKQILPADGKHFYVRAMSGDTLAGNVFACRWEYEGRHICWITQLVVSNQFRKQGLATRMLQEMRKRHPNDRGFGLLSSHPAAVRAALRAFGRGLDDVNLTMIKEHATAIMACSPVDYVKGAKLHGELFHEGGVEDGSVSCAFTNFFVDHKEPLEALEAVRSKDIAWPFGELPEGHEFLVLVKGKDDRKSRWEDQQSSGF